MPQCSIRHTEQLTGCIQKWCGHGWDIGDETQVFGWNSIVELASNHGLLLQNQTDPSPHRCQWHVYVTFGSYKQVTFIFGCLLSTRSTSGLWYLYSKPHTARDPYSFGTASPCLQSTSPGDPWSQAFWLNMARNFSPLDATWWYELPFGIRAWGKYYSSLGLYDSTLYS